MRNHDQKIQRVPDQYELWDLKKIVPCEICTSLDYIANFHQYDFYSIATSRNSTSTNSTPIALKIVQVEFVLVGDSLQYIILSYITLKDNQQGSTRLLKVSEFLLGSHWPNTACDFWCSHPTLVISTYSVVFKDEFSSNEVL